MPDNQAQKDVDVGGDEEVKEKKPASWLQRIAAFTLTAVAMWYLFGIPGYILFEKFIADRFEDAADEEVHQAASEE